MTDNSGEQYKAEITALSREIHRLNHQLEQAGKTKRINKYAPFDNPTDYPNFSGDYSVILPQLDSENYSIPLEPSYSEMQKLKRYYSIGGWCTLFHFLCSNIIIQGLFMLISAFLSSSHPDANANVIHSYIKNSSILIGMNTLTYMILNITFGFLGLKLAKVRKLQLVRTKDFGFSQIIQYCVIGISIWTLSMCISLFLDDLFSKYGYSLQTPNMDEMAGTATAYALATIYSCLIAPVTEEIFFRGMLLRVFSKANQRFAVLSSALFFGLCHGNIKQFVYAFFLGIFLGHITLKHNSIIPSVIVHIFLNTAVTVFSSCVENISDEEYVIVQTCLIALTAVGVFLFAVFFSNDKLPTTTPAQSRRGLYVASYSAPLVTSFLLYVAFIVYNTFF